MKNELWVCAHTRKCRWQGPEAELVNIRVEEYGMPVLKSTCPKCGGDQFYIESCLDKPDVKRDWWVYSTALATASLMVECHKTGAKGVVRDPTIVEWKKAFYAPSKPYRWKAANRVTITRKGASA